MTGHSLQILSHAARNTTRRTLAHTLRAIRECARAHAACDVARSVLSGFIPDAADKPGRPLTCGNEEGKLDYFDM
jgi:hypothetical protein